MRLSFDRVQVNLPTKVNMTLFLEAKPAQQISERKGKGCVSTADLMQSADWPAWLECLGQKLVPI